MSWVNAFMFCRSFNMDLAELTTEVEAEKFLKLFADNAPSLAMWHHIGGSYMGGPKNDYYWMTTAEKISYPLKFYPGEPNNYAGKEKCLSIAKHPHSFKFNDVDCYEHWIWNFVCEKIETQRVPSIDEKSSSRNQITDEDMFNMLNASRK